MVACSATKIMKEMYASNVKNGRMNGKWLE